MSGKPTGGIVISFLSGVVVGGIVALLYAPKSGKELRQDIKTKSGELADTVEDYLSDMQAKAKDAINEGKEKSAHLISEAKQKAENLVHDAEQMLADARKKMTDESTKLKTAVRAGVDAFKVEKNSTDTF